MSVYNIIALKDYNGYLQDKLMELNMKEMSAVKSHTNQLDIVMAATSNRNQRIMDTYNSKYGEHSHYFLLNENATQFLKDYQIPLNIIDSTEINDKEIPGDDYALLVRSVRFI